MAQHFGGVSGAKSSNGSGPRTRRGNTVGLAMIGDMLNAWPCVSKRHWKNYRLDYYEVEVKNAGSHGYIAVGWATDRFRNSQKQPGWVADTYGYHGDDGCAYWLWLRPSVRAAVYNGSDCRHRDCLRRHRPADLLYARRRACRDAVWQQVQFL